MKFVSFFIIVVFIFSGCKKDNENPVTPAAGTVTDNDGNVYHTVAIGKQVWMAEDLKTTKYNDGTPIPLVTDGTAWVNLNTPGCCWYNNDADTYKATYGALYNWYAVNTGKLAPAGWRVASDADWKTLEMSLGMTQTQADSTDYRGTDEGGKLKESGTMHWHAQIQALQTVAALQLFRAASGTTMGPSMILAIMGTGGHPRSSAPHACGSGTWAATVRKWAVTTSAPTAASRDAACPCGA